MRSTLRWCRSFDRYDDWQLATSSKPIVNANLTVSRAGLTQPERFSTAEQCSVAHSVSVRVLDWEAAARRSRRSRNRSSSGKAQMVSYPGKSSA